MADSRRQYERIDIELPCRLFIVDGGELYFEAFCHTGNLCLGGVFVTTDTLMRVGVDLTVELMLPDGPLAVAGRIVHRNEHEADEGFDAGMGVEFQNVDQNARETLLRYFTPERYRVFYESLVGEFPHIEKELEVPQISLVLNLWEEWKVRQEGGPRATEAGAPPPPRRRRR